MARLVIIVPVLNEAAGLAGLIPRLRDYLVRGHRVLVADGGSTDGTVERLEAAGLTVLTVPRGRARQMNAAVALAQPADDDLLLFLHADTILPSDCESALVTACETALWGFFAVRIDGASPLLRVVERMMTLRSRLTFIATGDQALFLTAKTFREVGGFPDQPLMEDIDMTARLKALGPPATLSLFVVTSGRRWEKHGVLRTILLMWGLRFLHFAGADTALLARLYGYAPPPKAG